MSVHKEVAEQIEQVAKTVERALPPSKEQRRIIAGLRDLAEDVEQMERGQ